MGGKGLQKGGESDGGREGGTVERVRGPATDKDAVTSLPFFLPRGWQQQRSRRRGTRHPIHPSTPSSLPPSNCNVITTIHYFPFPPSLQHH